MKQKSSASRMNGRVVAYIDGFNLYFGLKSAKWRRFYWLNVQLLVQNLLKAGEDLVFTKYFTSRVSYPPDKERRQSTFLEALETLNDFRIYYGHYQDLFDVALLISADSDLSAPVMAVRNLFPGKRVIVAFPPQRHSAQLQRLAHGFLQIGRAAIAKSVFPDKLQKADGFSLERPREWT